MTAETPVKPALIATATLALLAACTADPRPASDSGARPGASEAATSPELPAAPAPAPVLEPALPPEAEPDTPRGWHAVVLPAHRAMVDDAMARATAAATGDDEGSHHARVLLERAREPLQPGDIGGAWRVRSIQVTGGQGFVYPYFDATIDADGTGDASYRFAKTSGSQRRSGRLYPMDGAGFVFLGARTVNDESPRRYSGVATPGTTVPGEHDSAGRLLRIGPRELLMVLDAEGDRFELYHLRR